MNKISSWFWGLSKASKAGVLLVYILLLGAGGYVIAYPPGNTPPEAQASSGHVGDSSQATLAAVIEKQTVMKFSEEMPFKKQIVKDPTLAEGNSYIQTAGVKGKRNVTYEITYSDGIETDKVVVSEDIIEKPVDEVKVVGAMVVVEQTQTLGAQDKKEPKNDSDDSETPAPEPVELPARKVWVRVDGDWEKVCVTSDDSRYYNSPRVNKIEYENLSQCEETL